LLLPFRVAILDDYQGIATRYLGPLDETVEVEAFRDHVADDDELVARLDGFDAVIAMRERTPFQAQVLERLPSLRLLVTTGMSNAAIDLEAAARSGVAVCGTRSQGASTGELTIGLLLALARRIPHEDAAVRAGAWQTSIGIGLSGRTLGVIGLGRIGAQVATVALALGMHVVAWSENLTDVRVAEVGVSRAASLHELLTAADAVTIHLRLSDRTRGLLGRDELEAMKATALLVNTSRGPIVDEDALVGALESGSIAGAALDVFDEEPLPAGHPLLSAPNTVLTPHLGYVVEENYDVFFADAAEDVNAFLAGAPVRVLA
jgi:phosphoglycerate dehydrogenase-like enzyme